MNASPVDLNDGPGSSRDLTTAMAVLMLIALAAGFLTSGPAPASADEPTTDRPLRLAPPKMLRPPPPAGEAPAARQPAVSGAPVVVPGLPRSPAALQTAPPAPAVETGIRVDALTSIDPDTVGVLDEDEGGYGAAMWEGTKRASIDALLPRLPVNTASAGMRDLMRRLLLSPAAVPQNGAKEAGKTGKKVKSGDLVALRVRLLADMGDLDGAGKLLDATPLRNQNQALVRVEADNLFLANDNARACSLAAGQVRENDAPYWQKAFIFCQALAGETDKAALGVSLLRELGTEDPVYFTLIDGLTGGRKVAIDSLQNPSPLHLAMARAGKVQLPADVISSNRPAVLRTIAISPNASVELRLEAAERAEAAGALDAEALRQLYTSISFTEDELSNPLSKAEAESGPLSRALLYRTAVIQTVPTAQAEAVGRALSLGREGGRYASTVRVFMPVLRRIPPSPEMLWFANEAVRAFLVTRDEQGAAAWFSVLRASAMFDEKARATLAAVSPVARLADSEEARHWDSTRLAAWWEDIRERPDARERASLLFSLLEGLGDVVPDDVWEALLGGTERTTAVMPHPALWYRLASAADAGRKGETVLLVLLALGEGGPGQADPVVLRRVLTSLIAVGLNAEARALAVEAAVAADL
jgi:hypothetical protein